MIKKGRRGSFKHAKSPARRRFLKTAAVTAGATASTGLIDGFPYKNNVFERPVQLVRNLDDKTIGYRLATCLDCRQKGCAHPQLLADVAHVDGAPWAKLKTPNGDVKVLGTKFALTAATDRTNDEVLREYDAVVCD